MKTNTACITLEELEKLYASRERLAKANETLFEIAAIMRDHISTPDEMYNHEIHGFKFCCVYDMVNDIISVMFTSVPAMRSMLNLQKEKLADDVSSAPDPEDKDIFEGVSIRYD